MARYLTFGNLLVEDVVLPDGRMLTGRLGGDAVYAAIGARVFADDVQPVARIGRCFPPGLIRLLEGAGFGAGLIRSSNDSVRLRVDWGVEGGRRFTFDARSGSYDDATPAPEDIPPPLADRLQAVHLAPVPFDRMTELLRWARPRARVLTVDPHYDYVEGAAVEWRQVLPLVDAFLPSKDETSLLLGHWPGAEAAARALAALGARLVCVKLGAEGSLAYRAEDGETVRMPPASSDPVDPTGCGDAFCGGFLVGLAESASLGTALAYGALAASFAGEGHGAEHALAVDPAEVERRLARLSRPAG